MGRREEEGDGNGKIFYELSTLIELVFADTT